MPNAARRALFLIAIAVAGITARGQTLSLTPAFPGLNFNQPLAVVSPPGETNRLFVVEKEGRIVVIPNLGSPSRSTFLDLTARVGDPDGEQGLLALAFHPEYATNRQFYVWYTSDTPQGRFNRLSRFLASATNPNAADPATEQVLISQADEASNHNGGELAFGPDGYLYVAVGDEGGGNDTFGNSQRIDRDFFAGILRIDVDRRPGNLAPNPHSAVQAGTYSVPADNPYVGATTFNGSSVNPGQVRTEFWAVGLRNPWRMAFDAVTGQLWAADVGQSAREEIDIIVRGGNYGWSYREGAIAGPRAGAPASASFIPPVWDYGRTTGGSVTGGFVYRGNRYPTLIGKYLFADYMSGRVWALNPDGDRPVAADRVTQVAQLPGVAGFGIDPSTGDVLLASLSNGVFRIVAPTLAPSRLINLSTRAQVGTGADVLIPSFVIGPGQTKEVLIRAVGPSLSTLAVPGPLAATSMELRRFGDGQLLASNSGWNTAPNSADIRSAAARLGAVPLIENSADSAILARLDPGAYTVVTRGGGNSSGIALVEVYDAEAQSGPPLVNLGTRALVQSGAAIVISGLVIGDGQPKTLLIRAVGPGLTPLGVPGVLPEPVLTVFSGSEPILSNQRWTTAANAAAIGAAAARVGAFALDASHRDSALLATFPAGAYTIHVSSATTAQGVALVEVYEVP